ncbi:MAG: hypothetical protein AVDCRST_MAG02-2198, partial [uncultured Rubrobacteraceae bacterium]
EKEDRHRPRGARPGLRGLRGRELPEPGGRAAVRGRGDHLVARGARRRGDRRRATREGARPAGRHGRPV